TYRFDWPGIYQVSLKVTDKDNYSSEDHLELNIKSRPLISITEPQNGGKYQKEVRFSAYVEDIDGKISRYEWDFDGDGTTDWASMDSPVAIHTYSSPGTYTATLTVIDDDGLKGQSSVSFDVVFYSPEHVTASADRTKGYSPLVVNFDGVAVDPDGEIVKFQWDFDGDGDYDWGIVRGGEVVEFSSQYNDTTWAAKNLIDGIIATKESGGWKSVYRPTYPQYLIFKLGGDKEWKVDKILIDPETTEYSTRWAKNFRLYASPDGKNFTEIADGREFTLTNSAGFQEFTFTPTDARYVKLEILSNYGDGNYVELGEVEIYSGIYNLVTNISPKQKYTYTQKGTFTATLLAEDDDGYTSTGSIEVDVLDSAFTGVQTYVSALSGYAPITVTFSGYAFKDRKLLDNFETDSIDSNWSLIGGNWRIAKGSLYQQSNSGSDSGSDKYGVYAIWDASTYTDLFLSVDMKSSDDDTMGVIFRYTDDSSYYLFEWNRENREGVKHRRLLKRVSNGLVELASDDVPYESYKWYNIKIGVQGSYITVWIDGKAIFSVEDSSYQSGKVGLWCNYNYTYFDNIYVSDTPLSTYTWNISDGTQKSGISFSHTFSDPGTYTVTFNASDDNLEDSVTYFLHFEPAGAGRSKVWVVKRYNDKVALLKADDLSKIKEVVGFNDPYNIDVSGDGSVIWVSDYYGNKVYKILGDVPDGYDVSQKDSKDTEYGIE
ncbi:MAG: hypothetical protein DRN95_08960, partial [Candidatus Hydrothermarchaeota archaeon]